MAQEQQFFEEGQEDHSDVPDKQETPPLFQLARYQLGQVAYWVTLRSSTEDGVVLPPGDEWMAGYHPKVLFDRGLMNHVWPRLRKPPRLHHVDFQGVINILTSKLVVEQFEVNSISRSQDTGEFLCLNQRGEWMPESYLFDTYAAAARERGRIKRMVGEWASE